MHKPLLLGTALALVFASFGLAQQDTPAEGTAGQPAEGVVAPPAPVAETPDAATPAPATEVEAAEAEEAQAPPPEDVVQNQEEGQSLASDMMGSTVMNAEGESIGEINDLLLDENHTVEAALIGVGGFLGLGEKDVALGLDQFQWNPEQQAFTTDLTMEQLEAAPAFKRRAEVEMEQEAAQQHQEMQQEVQQAPPMAPAEGETAPATETPEGEAAPAQ